MTMTTNPLPTHSTAAPILVTGATGTVGSRVIRHLQARGVRPRAFVRDSERAQAQFGGGVDLKVGDFADPQSVLAALQGVDTVFLSCGNVPDQIPYECTVIDAARRAGVGRLVKLSARGASRHASNAYWRGHAEIEGYLAVSGIPSVVLQPSFLMSNLLAAADQIRYTNTLMAPAGSARISMIDPDDVALVAAIALTDPEVAPAVLVLTGPEAIGYEEVATHLSDVVGRPIRYVDVPPAAMVQGLAASGMPEAAAAEIVRVFDALRAGVQVEITDTVARIVGRGARSFAAFARTHAAAFSQETMAPV